MPPDSVVFAIAARTVWKNPTSSRTFAAVSLADASE
jgi:hypothetical protein